VACPSVRFHRPSARIACPSISRICFVGILIDTVRMVISFDSDKCRGFAAELRIYVERLERGEEINSKDIPYICEKLNWFSSRFIETSFVRQTRDRTSTLAPP